VIDDRADETDREKWRALDRIHARAREMRGGFLNKVAAIERRLALLLTEYFCTSDDGKREIFLDYVVGKMSLEQKRAVLIQILNMQPGNWDVEIWNEARLVARVFRRTSTGALGERPASSNSLS
jgi:hypothetical protein